MTAGVMLSGLGAVCSTGGNVASFTQSLRAGISGFVPVPDEFAESGMRLLAPVHGFDFSAALDEIALPSARIAAVRRVGRREPSGVQATIVACAQAWAHAYLDAVAVPAERVEVVVGGHNLTRQYVLEQHERDMRGGTWILPRYALQSQDSHLVAAISEAFGIYGEGYTVGASSASGNAAVAAAARMVGCGAADACLAVGPMIRLEPAMYAALDKLGVLARASVASSPRPFDKERAGFVPGEGAACVILESRLSVRQRGVPPIAELAGSAQVLAGSTLPSPDIGGESRAMTRALATAGAAPAQVGYVNAHATATPAGDDAEAAAIAAVLGSRPWVNATKGLIGHCLGAAGVIETVAVAIQMAEGFVHPNPGLVTPIGHGLRYAGPVAIETEIACALSNSFGFGGFNSSLVLVKSPAQQ
jgi:malonyl-ACP decarboxylase